MVKDILSVLKEKRAAKESVYGAVFKEAVGKNFRILRNENTLILCSHYFIVYICKSLEIEIHVPQIKQRSHKDVKNENIEEYFQCHAFIPFIESTVLHSEKDFSNHFHAAARLIHIIPFKCPETCK